ncbi:hypothetical protein [Nostoc cycadae]|uniref:Ubiquinone biosynthesis protein COQ7 n=1 Tax=Nostoc cycadae WK-1 TaxID=1861711 RepID=A0A2H6LEA2_9NOSO|nr:hypothetical protein [Nostoc cycadae]GBE91541.1 ubiquinone biosynthesis protein COQ7 [Nostoc cycadae WK-1]
MSILSAPPARSFIHSPSVGSENSAFVTLDLIDTHLDSLYSQQLILGYNLVVIMDEDQEADELISSSQARSVTHSLFPYLFARIQMPLNSQMNILDFMLRLDFAQIS